MTDHGTTAERILSFEVSDYYIAFDEPFSKRMAARAALKSAIVRALDEASGSERWTCFHCGDTFDTPESAQEHFGGDLLSEAACRIKASELGLVKALRDAEVELDRYRAEDSDKDREFHGMKADHAVALKREEEAGYSRGLADGMNDIAVWMLERGYATGHGDTARDMLCELDAQAKTQSETLAVILNQAHRALRTVDASVHSCNLHPGEIEMVCDAIAAVETFAREHGIQLSEFKGTPG